MPDDPGESSIIATLLSGRPAPDGFQPRLDAGDDVAVLPDGTAVGTDLMVEGVHWDDRLSPEDVGWKLVAVNASDLGATGARPAWATLDLALPRPVDGAWVDAFARGLHAGLAAHGVRLVGGDTSRSPGPRFASLTMGGPAPRPVRRDGARPGDPIWVSGTLGDAAAGFHHGGDGLAWLRRPHPPVGLGCALADAGLASAMMDLSDGLARDLGRLCAASGCAAQVDASALPASPQVRRAPDRLALQTAFGEDYQLLFTAPATADAAVRAIAEAEGTRVTRIGACVAGEGAHLRAGPWPLPTFSHFAGEA
jgi:thiamine-monophosphate kinase